LERSFVLLKPDCSGTGRSTAVEAATAAEGLRIACRHPLVLTPDDVRFLWSEYTDGSHALMRAFLDHYLCTGASEVLHLHGPDAFEAARRVKRTIRSRYANGPFANLVHTAERRGELARQANHLLGRCAVCADPFVSDEPPTNPARPPGRDFRQDADLPHLVATVWPTVRAADPPPPTPHRLDRGTPAAAVYLGADRANSLDSAVTAVWSALPGADLADAVLLTLYAGRVDGYPIAVGGHRAVEHSHRTLRAHGITACGVGPAPRLTTPVDR
jgi:nucleoside diphosphate kinase